MKTFSLFLVLLLILMGLSCQNKKQDTRHILLQRIAQDGDYIAYQQALVKNAHLVALGEYALAGIRALYDEYPNIGNACDFNKIDLKEIKGGILYQQIHCAMLHSAERLNTKFQFYKLSIEDLQQVEMLYERSHTPPNADEKNHNYNAYKSDVKFCGKQGWLSGRCMLEAEAAYAKGLDVAGDIFYSCKE